MSECLTLSVCASQRMRRIQRPIRYLSIFLFWNWRIEQWRWIYSIDRIACKHFPLWNWPDKSRFYFAKQMITPDQNNKNAIKLNFSISRFYDRTKKKNGEKNCKLKDEKTREHNMNIVWNATKRLDVGCSDECSTAKMCMHFHFHRNRRKSEAALTELISRTISWIHVNDKSYNSGVWWRRRPAKYKIYYTFINHVHTYFPPISIMKFVKVVIYWAHLSCLLWNKSLEQI